MSLQNSFFERENKTRYVTQNNELIEIDLLNYSERMLNTKEERESRVPIDMGKGGRIKISNTESVENSLTPDQAFDVLIYSFTKALDRELGPDSLLTVTEVNNCKAYIQTASVYLWKVTHLLAYRDKK